MSLSLTSNMIKTSVIRLLKHTPTLFACFAQNQYKLKKQKNLLDYSQHIELNIGFILLVM